MLPTGKSLAVNSELAREALDPKIALCSCVPRENLLLLTNYVFLYTTPNNYYGCVEQCNPLYLEQRESLLRLYIKNVRKYYI